MKFYFDKLSKLKEKSKGIYYGLKILKILDSKIEETSGKDLVKYYSYTEDKIVNTSFENLNAKLAEIYNLEYLYFNFLARNKLYALISLVFDGRYKVYNYRYKYDLYTSHNVLSFFFRILRDINNVDLVFNVDKILDNMNIMFFETSLNYQKLFLLEFLYDLEKFKVIDYDYKNNTIRIVKIFEKEFLEILCLSLDPLMLGSFNMYDTYVIEPVADIELLELISTERTEEQDIAIQDLIMNYVLSCSTKNVCFHDSINNLMYEKLRI